MKSKDIRRSEIVAVLALATDLMIGQPLQFAFRSCVAALRLADVVGATEADKKEIYFQALLRYVGCNADTYVLSVLMGDDQGFRREFVQADLSSSVDVMRVVARAVLRARPGASWLESAAAVVGGLARSATGGMPIVEGHCEVAERVALRLGLGDQIGRNLAQLYERWDGRGYPRKLAGDALSPTVQIVTLAQDAVIRSQTLGMDEARAEIAKRSGANYAPWIVDAFLKAGPGLLDGIEQDFSVEDIVALEPGGAVFLTDEEVDEAFLVIADFIDMRAPWLIGHSRAVADLATDAAGALGLPARDIQVLRLAALTHDLGEVGIPMSVWAKQGGLSKQERDDVRLHPYHSQRVLESVASFSGIAALVGHHHERGDGSGYYRGVSMASIPIGGRILAAAEAYQTAIEDRPYRVARSREAAAAELNAEARAGRLDRQAVAAILAAAGHRATPLGPPTLANLTRREIEALQHVAGGKSRKDVAAALGVASKTADNHIQSAYAKIGVTTRAGAILFAMEHGLPPK